MQGDALRALLQDELIASDVQCSQLVAHAALQIAGVSTDAFPARPVRNFSMVYVQVPVHPNQPPQVGSLRGLCTAPAVMVPGMHLRRSGTLCRHADPGRLHPQVCVLWLSSAGPPPGHCSSLPGGIVYCLLAQPELEHP